MQSETRIAEVEGAGSCSIKNDWVKIKDLKIPIAGNHSRAKAWKAEGHRAQSVSQFVVEKHTWKEAPEQCTLGGILLFQVSEML